MKEKGYISLLLFLFLVPLAGILLWPNNKLSTPASNFQSKNPYCRPEVDADRNPKADAPKLSAPSYSFDNAPRSGTPVPTYPPPPDPMPTQLDFPIPLLDPNNIVGYKLIKANIPIGWFGYSEKDYKELWDSIGTPPHNPPPRNPIYCQVVGAYDPKVYQYHIHFCQYRHKSYSADDIGDGKIFPAPVSAVDAKKFAVLYPISYTGNPGQSSSFEDANGKTDNFIFYADYHLIFLLHLDDVNNKPIDNPGSNDKGETVHLWLIDVYQQVNPDGTAVNPLPDSAINCVDNKKPIGQVVVMQNPNPGKVSQDKKQLQLQHLIPNYMQAETNWYYPSCKPAIYLYPKEKTFVNVKVNTKGFLTYTDPLYNNLLGWNATAYPGGKLLVDNKVFNYLYYESKIKDADIKKPEKGYVVSFEDLPKLYKELLPKLGLIEKEAKEFKEYWEKVLSKSKYYFVGVMEQDEIEELEPLTTTPKPDTIIRVRLFFEALEQEIKVDKPEIITPERKGFTLVEWGGLVKVDKNHPFTCSQ